MLQRVIVVIVLQAAIGYFAVPEITADEIDAQTLYKNHCITCHGEDGKGKTDLGEGLGARDFTDKEFQDSITDEQIIEQITNGTEEKMFPFKEKLTVAEIKSLVSVVRAFGEK
ncbi:MAG: c-type cytochrome [Candidatus Scalindua sp.]|nr:c-type cytochrome [Candidatus Scalindua sp.]